MTRVKGVSAAVKLVCLLLAALAAVLPQRWPEGTLSPRIDGPIDRTEWARAGRYLALDDAPGGVEGILFGWNEATLFLALQHQPARPPRALALERGERTASRPLGRLHLEAGALCWFERPGGTAPRTGVRAARGRGSVELAVPWALLGIRPGDTLLVSVETAAGSFPPSPLAVIRPGR